MSLTVWARQRDSIGLYPVCSDASTRDERGQSGWDLGINFGTLDEFRRELDRALIGASSHAHVHAHVMQLAIAAHGSDTEGGQGAAPSTARTGSFAIEGRAATQMHISNIDSYAPFIAYLNTKLEANAIVYLMGCVVAATTPGRQLIMELSRRWPGRKVVAFGQEGHQASPNQTRAGGFVRCEEPGMMIGTRWADWGHGAAVVALRGVIVRG
jgi:hypothetical protein